MQINQIDPSSSEAMQLISDLDRYQAPLYPSESNHLDSIDELKKENVFFVGALSSGKLVGIGAIKKFAQYAEIKRMYVDPEYRREGYADAILATLELHATDAKIPVLRLETGENQIGAVKFYKSMALKIVHPSARMLKTRLVCLWKK
jgi:putative acetyltransferase